MTTTSSVVTRRERFPGQAMVEFAVIATLFFSLIYGVIEGGRLLFTYHQVNHAAREGARYAVAHGSKNGSASDEDILAHIQSTTTGLNLALDDLDVDALDGGRDPGQRVRVTVDHDFVPIVGLIFGTSSIPLQADSTMRFHY